MINKVDWIHATSFSRMRFPRFLYKLFFFSFFFFFPFFFAFKDPSAENSVFEQQKVGRELPLLIPPNGDPAEGSQLDAVMKIKLTLWRLIFFYFCCCVSARDLFSTTDRGTAVQADL